MTDEERIARLTELARRVWPDELADNIPAVQQEPGHWVEVYGKHVSVVVSVRASARALDALEAALLALAGEPPAWVEQLAREWEANADDTVRFKDQNPPTCDTSRLIAGAVLHIGDAFRRCARELRERAKGEPCE